jgi:hypothetical protein
MSSKKIGTPGLRIGFERWFAWYPVTIPVTMDEKNRTVPAQRVWWREVERRPEMGPDGNVYQWHYRLKPEQAKRLAGSWGGTAQSAWKMASADEDVKPRSS